jgi:hypothetical protein
VRNGTAGLLIAAHDPYNQHPLLSWPRPAPLPALSTPGLHLERARRSPVVAGPDGTAVPVARRTTVAAVPVLGRTGSLLDLATALRGAGGVIPGTTSSIVARPDTPASVTARLRATGAVEGMHTLEGTRARIDQAGTARRTALYLLVAAFCMVVAAVSVVSGVSTARRGRALEAAALRVSGVDTATLRRSSLYESSALAVIVLVAALAGASVCCRALLGVLPLTDLSEHGIPFDAHPPLGALALLATVAAVAFGGATFLGVRTVADASPPRTLREDA